MKLRTKENTFIEMIEEREDVEMAFDAMKNEVENEKIYLS